MAAIPAGGPSLAALEGVWILHEAAPEPSTTSGWMAPGRSPRTVEGWIVEAGRARKLEPEQPARPDSKLPDAAFIRETAGTLELLSPCTLAWHATGALRRWTEHYTIGQAPDGAWSLGGELSGVRVGEQLVLCGFSRVVVLAEGHCGEHTHRDEGWSSEPCTWQIVEVGMDRITLLSPLGEPLVLYLRGDLLFTAPTPKLRFETIAEPELRRRVAAEGRGRAREAWQRAQPGLGVAR